MAKLVHLACFAINSVPYFEYIESAANWADEISRDGAQGNWAPRNAFSVGECGVAVELLTLPCLAVIKIFEYCRSQSWTEETGTLTYGARFHPLFLTIWRL